MSDANEIEFYRKYGCTLEAAFDKLFPWALYITKNVDDAEDLTQDLLERLITSTPTNPVKNWAPYMKKTLHHLFIDNFFRHGHNREIPTEEIPERSADGPEPEARAIMNDLIRRFWKEVDRLDETQRIITRLRYCEKTLDVQRTHKEIAKLLGMPEGTTSRLLSEALRIVRRRLEWDEGTGN